MVTHFNLMLFLSLILNIRITQMLIFFGTICLICFIGSTFTDENLPQTSQCIQPIEYNISLEIQNTSLLVNSTVLLNVSCEQQYIRLQIGRYCNLTDKIKVQNIRNISYTFPVRWDSLRSQSSYSSKHRFESLDISLYADEQNRTRERKENRRLIIKRDLYTISSICNCRLEEVATVFSTYRNQSKTKKFLILPRIPNEWIFPYWENLAVKARITIQIKHNDTDTIRLNMPEVFGTRILHTVFSTTRLISTNLVALVVIPNVYEPNIVIDGYSTITSSLEMKNDTFYARNVILDTIGLLRKMWKDIIPRSHVNYILLPITSTHYKSIITPGFVLLNEVNSIYNREVDSIEKEKKVTCFVTRSVIQELFSDWLTTFRQSNSWFLEGFLTVYGVYIRDQFYNTSLLQSMVVQTRREFLDYIEAFKYDFIYQNISLLSRNSTLSKLWQEKAFSTFYMLNTVFEQDFLYTSMFKEAVTLYYNTDNTSNNTCNELSILEKLKNVWDYWNFGKYFLYKPPYMKLEDIKSMITSWTTHNGYPVIEIKRHNDTQHLIVRIINCFDVDHKKPCEQKWWIPVTFKKIYSKVINTYRHVLKPKGKTTFTSLLNENEIAIVVDHSGYRVNYDREFWKRIAFFLKNVDPKIVDLSDVDVAQLLDDAFYFLVQNTEYNEDPVPDKSDLDIYLELASSLFQVNNSYTAWYPFFIALENMSKIFPFPESVLSKHIKEKLLEILNKFLDDISYTHSSENNITNQFYHEVLKWTCILGSVKCKKHLNELLQWHLIFVHNKLLSSWQKWIYCQGLMLETFTYEKSTLWRTIFNIYQAQGNEEEFFKFLPCSKQYKNLYNFFLFLERNCLPILESNVTAEICDTVNIVNAKKSVRVTLLFNIFALHSNNNLALNIILLGLNNGIGRNVSILAIINYIINNIYSDYGLSMITNEIFLKKLLDVHHMEPFVLDVIKEKAEIRGMFLAKMENTIYCEPQYIFNYKRYYVFTKVGCK